MPTRKILRQQRGQPASDGNGVRLLRVFGGGNLQPFDPFLMLDEFGSDQPEDYIGGFPPHPHRGFETVTYMLHGRMEHQDHLGNTGVLDSGGVQWMTAGRGIIHSEMPLQRDGLMRGFQLWVNLPAASKMKPAAYQDVPAERIPRYRVGGCQLVGIAGNVIADGQSCTGYFQIPDTAVNFFDLLLPPGQALDLTLATDHRALLYCYEGAVAVGSQGQSLGRQALAQLSAGDRIQLHNGGSSEARVLLLSGAAIGEPIVQYGPFVMNSREEIEQALDDYRRGTLATPPAAGAEGSL